MSVLPTTSVSGSDYIASTQTTSSPSLFAPDNALDQTDFLRLLTTQLQNQDPSSPMDPTKFVTDLTQMSQLEATTQMTASITAMTNSFQNLQTMQAATLIGKSVVVKGEEISLEQGDTAQFRLESDQPLEDVRVVLTGENGMSRTIELGSLSGEEVVNWDGLMTDGSQAMSGSYNITAYGINEDGELSSIRSIVDSKVNSVSIDQAGGMTLTLASGERISMDAVREISG